MNRVVIQVYPLDDVHDKNDALTSFTASVLSLLVIITELQPHALTHVRTSFLRSAQFIQSTGNIRRVIFSDPYTAKLSDKSFFPFMTEQ